MKFLKTSGVRKLRIQEIIAVYHVRCDVDFSDEWEQADTDKRFLSAPEDGPVSTYHRPDRLTQEQYDAIMNHLAELLAKKIRRLGTRDVDGCMQPIHFDNLTLQDARGLLEFSHFQGKDIWQRCDTRGEQRVWYAFQVCLSVHDISLLPSLSADSDNSHKVYW